MADQALFIGWGDTVAGREAKAVGVFNDSVAYWGKLQGDGKIESLELAFLTPHGGDLVGFALLRGSEEQLDAVAADDEFNRQLTRAGLVVHNLGAVRAYLGESIQQQMEVFQAAIDELA